ncbi:MAG: hypothetical protein FWC66_06515 [Oscillospiraceae bacterium]|nr:hypothetical protein [Oscillospiraceae bacterium]
MNTSKVAITTSIIFGKIASIVGYTLGPISLFLVIFALVDLHAVGAVVALVFFLLLLALSVFLIIKGAQTKRRIKRFRQYISLISVHHMTSIDNIAANTSQSAAFVRSDLQQMINKKFFCNAYIDALTNEIVIGGTATNVASQASNISAPQGQLRVTTCVGCGATNSVIEGQVAKCEYCGSPIQYR